METLDAPTLALEKLDVLADIFSQAITGELIGMSNFASLADTIDDPHEKMEAVEHANSERMHAEGFISMADSLNLPININLQSTYWGGIRAHFLRRALRKDFIGCLIIQEVMLESFAVSMYTDVGKALGGSMGELFLHIAEEEKEHLEHSSEILRSALQNDPLNFIANFEEIHFECMTILAQFSARTDMSGHCGVCHGNCMKGNLHHVDLDIVSMRGNALALYARALDNIGIPGEKSIIWIANLPA